MDVLPEFLQNALSSGTQRLERAARATALGGIRGETQRRLAADTAGAAIFADALLSAAHARLAELKTAAKSA